MSNEQIMREGKTRRDHESGAWERRIVNRNRRIDWQKSSDRDCKNFPWAACNGKRNRFKK